MQRIFLGLAITNGTLLAVAFGLGLVASGEERGPGEFWHGLHFLVALVATMATLFVHSIVFTYFLGTGKWVKEVVRVYELPDWVHAQAVRNKRRAFPFEFFGMALVGATAWLGAASDTIAGWSSLWHLWMAAVALAFNLAAFAVEYGAILAQARLLIEVKDQADRRREALTASSSSDIH